MKKVDELIWENFDARYLSVAEYICADIIRAANDEKLLDANTFTRFLQYGWIDTAVARCVPSAFLFCNGQLRLDGLDGGAFWRAGVRLSVASHHSQKGEIYYGKHKHKHKR